MISIRLSLLSVIVELAKLVELYLCVGDTDLDGC